MSKTQQESNEEYYISTSTKIEQDIRYAGKSMDQIVVLLTTGAIVLSASFALELIKLGGIRYLEVLLTSWLFLLITLLCHFIAYIYSECEGAARLQKLKKWMLNGFSPNVFNTEVEESKKVRLFNKLTRLCLIVGLTLLAAFAYLNLTKLKNMDTEKFTKPDIKPRAPSTIIAPNPVMNPEPQTPDNPVQKEGENSNSN